MSNLFKFIASICLSLVIFFPTSSAYAKKSANKKPQVTILTASWCAYCDKMRQFLKNNQVPFTEYDIEKSNLGYQLYRSLNAQGVPVVQLGEKVLFGYNPDKLQALLIESGYHLP